MTYITWRSAAEMSCTSSCAIIFLVKSAYTLSMSVDAPGSCIRLENMQVTYGSPYTGTYFAECGVTLQAEIGPSQEFDHWLVNGVVQTRRISI